MAVFDKGAGGGRTAKEGAFPLPGDGSLADVVLAESVGPVAAIPPIRTDGGADWVGAGGALPGVPALADAIVSVKPARGAFAVAIPVDAGASDGADGVTSMTEAMSGRDQFDR